MSNRLLVGRYELIEKIGEGGMATVYKAKDRLLNRFVAIKVLRPEFTKDAQFIENFRKESQAAAGLTHPNIVSVYDVGREGNIHFIVMELVEGRTLSDIIKEKGPLEYKETVNIMKQVISALALAHNHGIIHRDVKPHNILITQDGVAKLADFGIAKAINDSTLSDSKNNILGSVHYFSPEQARGSYVDERSDIYSTGIVMYEMLTGKVPFDGDTAVSIALMHINDTMKRPSELVGGIPPVLERIVLKATDKVQTNRFKSADEMLKELENIEFLSAKVGDSILAGAEPKKVEEPEPVVEPRKKIQKKEKKKLTKKQLYIIVAACVCAIPILYFILTGVGLFNDSKYVPVPDLKGMTIEQATDILEKYDLEIKEGQPTVSADVNKDLVCMQDPVAKSKVKRGTVVTVKLSTGKKQGVVPNLIGSNIDDVEKMLESFGLQLGKVTYRDDAADEGAIIEQSPASGEQADEGAYISVVVSKGGGQLVPNLIGKTVSEAKELILSAGYKVGSVDYEESNAYSKDYVMWQSEDPNTKASKGTTIDITVSKGAPSAGDSDGQ
ncbi:MAG: Stk1 family PASTA domain-containing Ser/Thr kinase [Clostridia bacterium]|nr:Stk1 family PASTA domain-containing Ser/Thr kinase [Clostridia bacterium]